MWECLAKVMLLEPKREKFKTSNCMFIGYAANSIAYRFLFLKSDVLDYNTIIETKNVEFFEHIYPLNEKFSYAYVNDNRVDETHIEEVRRKKQRKETSLENDFFT